LTVTVIEGHLHNQTLSIHQSAKLKTQIIRLISIIVLLWSYCISTFSNLQPWLLCKHEMLMILLLLSILSVQSTAMAA